MLRFLSRRMQSFLQQQFIMESTMKGTEIEFETDYGIHGDLWNSAGFPYIPARIADSSNLFNLPSSNFLFILQHLFENKFVPLVVERLMKVLKHINIFFYHYKNIHF